MNQQTIQGNWNEIKGKLRSRWGELTDDDLMEFNGNVQQLVGTIQRKTGEARESIEQFFEQLSSERSAKSLMVSFGAGIITGIAMALIWRRR